jgi:chaperonin GroES
MSIKEGDRIILGKYAGNEIEINGVKHLIISEDDILGVIVK